MLPIGFAHIFYNVALCPQFTSPEILSFDIGEHFEKLAGGNTFYHLHHVA